MKAFYFWGIFLLGLGAGFAIWFGGEWKSPHGELDVLAISAPPPGTTYNPTIRVNVTPQVAKSLKLAIDGPFRIQPVGNEKTLYTGSQLAECVVRPTSVGFQMGNIPITATRIEIVPQNSPAIWINGRKYRKAVRVFRQPGGSLVAVNSLPLEDYLSSVVDSEMPIAFSTPARRAQAVVGRTYALYQLSRTPRHPLFDVYADTRSQKYLGYQYRDANGRLLAGESENSRQIVKETAGLVCTFHGKIFCTYYSAVCGGRTTVGTSVFSDASPALASVMCDWCREAPLYRWDREIPILDVLHALASKEPALDQLQSIRVLPNNAEQQMPQLLASDQEKSVTMATPDFRRALSTVTLPSPFFEAEKRANEVDFHGRGHGHGVGLCQWGARGQGRSQRSFLQILAFYYPGSKVVRLRAP